MELRRLEHFLAVVEEGSVTRAAARLNMVQSSLSSSILGLERDVGAPLFTRSRHGTTLTDAGQALLPVAREIVTDVDRAYDAVSGAHGVLRGTARVATVAVPRSVDITDVLGPYRRDNPNVQVHVLYDGTQDLLDLVRDGEVDFAVTPLTSERSPHLSFEALLTTPLVLLCPAGHALAGRRDVVPKEVASEEIIDLPRSWWVRQIFDEMCDCDDVSRTITLEVNEWWGALTMVERGVGVGYGPEACIDRSVFPDLEIAQFADSPQWALGIATLEGGPAGAAARSLLERYREHCAKALADIGLQRTGVQQTG
jgi:DNA-binding transcriptional LysR family regulator